MIKTKIFIEIKTIENSPFYDYYNGLFYKSINQNRTLYQSYNRGEGNPLYSFINDFNNKINEFIYSLIETSGYNSINSNQFNNFKNYIYNNISSKFYDEFMNNKHIIDTTIIDDEYIYDGGETTCSFTINTAVSFKNKISKMIIKNKLNNILYSPDNEEPNFIYKIDNINIYSNRW